MLLPHDWMFIQFLDLTKDEYSFGRGDDNDYQFNSPMMRKHPCFQAYSKVHFQLKRVTIICDLPVRSHFFLLDSYF